MEIQVKTIIAIINGFVAKQIENIIIYMRTLFFVITLWCNGVLLQAQKVIVPTEAVTICGSVKMNKSFTIADLDVFPVTELEQLIIYNHRGEAKDTLRNIKGVALKGLLAAVELNCPDPKSLSEFYFVFAASDGYRVVFSWNEIYNTKTGDECYIVTEIGGKKGKDIEQRILFMSSGDKLSGRRYIKALERIEVRRID